MKAIALSIVVLAGAMLAGFGAIAEALNRYSVAGLPAMLIGGAVSAIALVWLRNELIKKEA